MLSHPGGRLFKRQLSTYRARHVNLMSIINIMAKTNSLGIRVQRETKAALEKAAADDMRSMSSLIDKILVEWLRRKSYLKA